MAPVPSMEVKFYELGNHQEQIELFRAGFRVVEGDTVRVPGTGTGKLSSMRKALNESTAICA
jgi:hypothetical protein